MGSIKFFLAFKSRLQLTSIFPVFDRGGSVENMSKIIDVNKL